MKEHFVELASSGRRFLELELFNFGAAAQGAQPGTGGAECCPFCRLTFRAGFAPLRSDQHRASSAARA